MKVMKSAAPKSEALYAHQQGAGQQESSGTVRQPLPVKWYRTPLPPDVLRALCQRSDFRGGLQSVSHLAVMGVTGGLAVYAAGHWPVWVTGLLLFVYGTAANFCINAVHEFVHGTVFKTVALNAVFVRIYAFVGWQHFQYFHASHMRHHQYTLHPPDDLEVVLPQTFTLGHFCRQSFVVPNAVTFVIGNTWRLARGRFKGEWELTLFPADAPERARPVIRWAWTLLVGHALILVLAVCFRLWLLPVVASLSFCYGRWLHNLLNATQHIGLKDKVSDFRLCCRTILVNPVCRFLYWQMNYHTEHHMYAGVPFYNLSRLHRLIRHELPPCPRGIVATWRQIAEIQARQKQDPTYCYLAPLPVSPAKGSLS